MKPLVPLMLYVNDLYNGRDTQRLVGLDIHAPGSGETLLSLRGPALVCVWDAASSVLQVGRVTCQGEHYEIWVGNWCWNRVWVKPADAARIIYYLARHNWGVDGGATALFDKFQARQVISGDELVSLLTPTKGGDAS